MKRSRYNVFFKTASAVLTLTAVAKIWTLTGHAKILDIQDPLLQLSYRPLLISVAVIEVCVAVLLLRARNDLWRSLVLSWLSSNCLFYHLGNYLLNIHLCPCLGALDDNLPVPKGSAQVIVQFTALYWLITSLNILLREWWAPQWERGLSAGKRFFFRLSATGANRA